MANGVVNEHKSGDIRLNRHDRIHTELVLVVRGSARVVMTELKQAVAGRRSFFTSP